MRAVGLVVYLLLVSLFLWAFVFGSFWYGWTAFFGVLLVVFFRGFLIGLRNFFIKVSMLENYISYSTWDPVPKAYTYDQISEVETVTIREDQWTFEPESYVKVTFADRSVLKIPKSLMDIRDFRKILQENAGRKFRKSSKKGKTISN